MPLSSERPQRRAIYAPRERLKTPNQFFGCWHPGEDGLSLTVAGKFGPGWVTAQRLPTNLAREGRSSLPSSRYRFARARPNPTVAWSLAPPAAPEACRQRRTPRKAQEACRQACGLRIPDLRTVPRALLVGHSALEPRPFFPHLPGMPPSKAESVCQRRPMESTEPRGGSRVRGPESPSGRRPVMCGSTG